MSEFPNSSCESQIFLSTFPNSSCVNQILRSCTKLIHFARSGTLTEKKTDHEHEHGEEQRR